MGAEGLEPSRLAPLDPKSSLSANFSKRPESTRHRFKAYIPLYVRAFPPVKERLYGLDHVLRFM